MKIWALGLVALAVAGCEPVAAPTGTPKATGGGDWQALDVATVKARYAGHSYRVSSKASDGTVYYLGTNGRFLNFDPNAELSPPRFFDGGDMFTFVSPDHAVGNEKRPVEAICANSEITNQKMRLCHSFIEKDGVVYLYGDKTLPLEFFKGYAPMAERVLNRADLLGETAVLGLLAREFPDYSEAAAAYRKWDARNAEGRALNSAIRAQREKEEAAQAAAALAMVGWVVNTGVRAVQSAAASGGGGSAAPVVDTSTEDAAAPDVGVRVDGDNWIYENGKRFAQINFYYSWRISCEYGYNAGDSDRRDYDSKEQVVATALAWCKRS